MPSPKSGRERNWYKLATIFLTIVTIVISFISSVYYRRADRRNERLKELEARTDALLVRREKIRATPKVDVTLLTLASSGLPEAAFGSLREVPAVLRIQHSGGSTAKGVTVVIEATEPITRVTPGTSVENYVTRLSEDKRVFTIDVPQLRPKAALDVILMSRGVSRWTSTASVAEGVIPDSEPRTQAEFLEYWSRRRMLRTDDDEPIDPSTVSSEEQIADMLQRLRAEVRTERGRPLLLPESGRVALWGVLLILVVLLIALGTYDLVRGREAKRIGQRIRDASLHGRVEPGGSRETVERILGEPDKITVEGDSTSPAEVWHYQPYDSLFFGSQPHATVRFVANGIVSVEYQLKGDEPSSSR